MAFFSKSQQKNHGIFFHFSQKFNSPEKDDCDPYLSNCLMMLVLNGNLRIFLQMFKYFKAYIKVDTLLFLQHR